MKINLRKLILGLVVAGCAGLFGWLTLSDVQVTQTPVSITISNDRFYQ